MDLALASARHAIGLLGPDELAQLADSALASGIYSPALDELASLRKPVVMADAAPLFEAAIAELGGTIPTASDAAWHVARQHLSEISNGGVSPQAGRTGVS